MNEKCYIIGSGIVGCVIARELAERGKEVCVLEKRDHLGGNLFDCKDEWGVHIHRYGPHIFHTNDKVVYDYVSRYCEFSEYRLECGSQIDGRCVSTPFDFSAVDTFFPEEKDTIKNHIWTKYGNAEKASVLELLNSEDPYIYKFARYLFEKDYQPYTAKQWGLQPEEIDPQILERVPVLFSYGASYFSDQYQMMPVKGYMELITNLLDSPGIHTEIGTDGLSRFSVNDDCLLLDGKAFSGSLVYTGPIDELFDCYLGRLPYRSLTKTSHT